MEHRRKGEHAVIEVKNIQAYFQQIAESQEVPTLGIVYYSAFFEPCYRPVVE
ncbi:hypothetical protein [Methylacidiphilum kamchatkense]|uniref:hypothetical protein n=1 Tax=Methylacidiphilum kamchatkense TaxID=431057 RepID=UPI000B180DC8|nr:hypothetical protein [Methylacidiphilum kamchatkense]